MSSKVIAVFGATGAQGGSVLRALLKHGYQIRALTRSAKSEKAQSLAKLQNVTVVEANLDDAATLDQALSGSYGVFLVTDFSAHFEGKEVQQGKNAIDAAVKAGVSHFVFSGLDDVKSLIGKDCYHFDYKYEIEQYGLQQGNKLNFTSLRMACYFESLTEHLLHKINDNFYALVLPMGGKRMFGLSVDETGECVASLFNAPDEYRSKIVPISTSNLLPEEYLAILNKHLTPIKFVHNDMPLDQYEKLPFPGALDLARMFEFFQSGKMVRDIELTKKINNGALDFEAWIIKNKEHILDRIRNAAAH